MPTKVLEGSQCKGWLGKDGIMRLTYEANAQIGLGDTKNNIQLLGTLLGREKRPLLMCVKQIQSIDQESGDYLFNKGSKMLSAVALIVESAASKMIGDFLLGLNKSVLPAKLFTSKTEALLWLAEFVE